MKLSLDQEGLKNRQLQLLLTHGDRVLVWNVSAFDKKTFMTDESIPEESLALASSSLAILDEPLVKRDIYLHINQYWDRLPGHKQEKIFLIFTKIRSLFDEVFNVQNLITDLIPLVKDLYEEHHLEDIYQWMNFHSDIIIPDSAEEEYIKVDEKPSTREKTYLKSDYRWLAAFTISLRIMVPIWGEFIYKTKRETGTHHKEFYAYHLLTQTHLINSIPMNKLRVYVESNIQIDKYLLSIIIDKGIATEDFSTWLLGMVLVRRLCVGDISGTSKTSSLITYIYNFIVQKVSGNNSGSYSDMVKGKEFEKGDSSNDHNTSRLESYKLKLEVPIGSIMFLEHYMDDPVRVAQRIKPDIDLNILNDFLQAAKALDNEQIWKPQVTLVVYMLRKVLSPRGVVHLNKKQVIAGIAISQTLLWQSNNKMLACLITAIATSSFDGMMISGIDSRARITKEYMDELNILFPYNKVSATKKKSKTTNSAVLAIDELAQLFGQRDWILTIPDKYMTEVFSKESTRRFSCPQDIKILLAKLIIELYK